MLHQRRICRNYLPSCAVNGPDITEEGVGLVKNAVFGYANYKSRGVIMPRKTVKELNKLINGLVSD